LLLLLNRVSTLDDERREGAASLYTSIVVSDRSVFQELLWRAMLAEVLRAWTPDHRTGQTELWTGAGEWTSGKSSRS